MEVFKRNENIVKACIGVCEYDVTMFNRVIIE